MGLTDWLARQALRRSSVLLAELPGGWRTRVYAERCVVGRGWHLADSPAGADMLVVCGQLPRDLEDSVEAIWEQLPGPRVRISLAPDETQQGVTAAVEAALPRLRDTAAQRVDAAGRSLPEGMDHEGMDHEGMDHEGMDHEGMDMAPNGIALAEGADDRDGLEMDELHLKLGPVLRHWPAGLEMTWTLHGDLVAAAEGRWCLAAASSFEVGDGAPAGLLADAVRDLLQLAGWTSGADLAMRVRDLSLGSFGHDDDARLAREADTLVRRARRSRTLRWSLGGLGRVGPDWLNEHQLPPWWAGDAHDRLLRLLETLHAQTGTAKGVATMGDLRFHRPEADHLTRLCTGAEVAAARLVIASLALPLGSLVDVGAGVRA